MLTKLTVILILIFSSILLAQEPYPAPGLKTEFMESPEFTNTGNKYYVAITNVNGDGTIENPFNNIQNALDILAPGDIVYIMPGTYYIDTRLRLNNAGTENERICIRAYDPNDKPVLIRTGDINGNGIYDYDTTFAINGNMYNEYGGEIILIKSPYYIIDGLIMDGNFAIQGFYYKYVMPNGASNEKSFRLIVAIPHYGGIPIVGTGAIPAQEYLGYNGDNTIIRNCKIGNNQYDGIYISADNVLIENTEIHHTLNGNFTDDKVDAHGIDASHLENLTVRHCDIHHNSGDCIQIDHDVTNRDSSKLWDNLVVEHTKLWNAPLEEDAAGFFQGENPGENGIDTKTFEGVELAHRPRVFIKNVEAFGFTANSYMPRRCPFNIKYHTEWVIDGVTVYNNELAFRTRGPYLNRQGGANVTLKNIVAYNNDLVFRFERYIEKLKIYNSTFVNNTLFAQHADVPTLPAYDAATFECLNNLFLDEKPADAFNNSNLAISSENFVDIANNDYQLIKGSPAIDMGINIVGVALDRTGKERPIGTSFDVGAFEYEDLSTVDLLVPNTNLKLQPGNEQVISWDYSEINNVQILFTTDNGFTWEEIVSNLPAANQSYTWLVPVVNSDSCRIKICDQENFELCDISEEIFSIKLPPSLTLITPVGGEQFLVGSKQEIFWSAVNVDTVMIYYTINKGASYTKITKTALSSEQPYIWTVPPQVSDECQIRIVYKYNSSVTDDNEEYFSIIGDGTEKSLVLDTPTGGEQFLVGSNVEISWSAVNVETVMVYYTINNGESYTKITKTALSSEQPYVWTVPSEISDMCQIRIVDKTNSSITDDNETFFSIVPDPNLKKNNSDEEIITKYSLDQNWPNPFNPTTRISFAVPKPGMVSLKVYDIFGSEVAELVNEYKDTGIHVVSFDGSKLSSGVFFYKLSANNYSSIKKMLLIK